MSEHDPAAGLQPLDIDALVEARHPDPFSQLGLHQTDVGSGGARAVAERRARHGDFARRRRDARRARADRGPGCSRAVSTSAAPYRLAHRLAWHDAGNRGHLFVRPRSRRRTAGPSRAAAIRTRCSNASARGRWKWTACRACASPCGRRMRGACRWSATSTAWDGRRHPMRLRHQAGVWELFVPRVGAGTRYKYEMLARDGHPLPLKADPCAMQTRKAAGHRVGGRARRRDRAVSRGPITTGFSRAPTKQTARSPISIYEVHAESWLRVAEEGQRGLNWEELAERLIPYVKSMGFTHVEFMPIAEHPFGGSWGYQPLGQFAPSARFGKPEQFAQFVDSRARSRARRDSRLGARAFSERRARSDRLRRHAALRARRPARRLSPGLEHDDLQPRPQRGERVPGRVGAGVAEALSRRWLARGCGGVDAVSRLFARGRRMGAEHLRRPRKPRIDRVPEAAESRSRLCAGRAGRNHDRRGIDRVAGRDRAASKTAGSASSSSGTWAGCTTRCTTWKRTRSIANTIITT